MPARILIIDSIASNRVLTRAALADAQYEIAVAETIEEAHEEIRRSKPGLILLGIVPPAAAAFAFCAALRADPKTRALPVIATGRLVDPALRLAVLRAGADDLCSRPINAALLQARIRRLMRRNGMLADLCLKEETHRALGFAEDPPEYETPHTGRVSAVAPEGQAMLPAVATVFDRLPGKCEIFDPNTLLALSADDTPDLLLIDAAADGLRPGELFRLIAELRSQAATRNTVQIALIPTELSDMAAMALDLGVDDVVSADVRPGELMHRVQNLLSHKVRADQARDTLRSGIESSVIDPLTGLYNRRYALPHLASIAERAQSTRQMAAVMMLDIDHFKSVNDRYGHAAGDRVLSEVAARLTRRVRVGDLVARIGGEEFLIVMPNTTAEEASDAAERLRRGIEDRPFEAPKGGFALNNAPPVRVTVSIGVALGYGDEEGKPSLFDRADAALYKAKTAGRNMVALARPAA
ncbi:MAG: diguanylate cyclase [Rhodobacteraceae bacterium]|nr:diguanylate cyclase [Paracoccaceae bacterium]